MSRRVVLLIVGIALAMGCAEDLDPLRSTPPPEGPPGVPPACDAELELFERELFRPILSVRCIGCHNEEGAAGHTRMVLTAGADEASRMANFEAVSRVALSRTGETPDLLLRPTGRHPDGHTGGALITPTSVDYDRLTAFVEVVEGDGCDEPTIGPSCDAEPTYGPRTIRRLTPDEYDATVSALLGIDSTLGDSFPADPEVDGFANQSAALVVSPLLAEQLRAAAVSLSEDAVTDVDALTGCAGDATEACARAFIERFGRRAFRRSLTGEELDRYVGLYREASADGFDAGIALVLQGILQSPHFLYRMEIGVDQGDGTARLEGPEVASALSYLLTGGPPSDGLLASAEAGELDTGAGRRAAAEALLDEAGTRTAFARFVRQWLDLDRIVTVPKDAAAHPEFDATVRRRMLAEVDAFVEAVVFDGEGTLTAMLTAPRLHPDPVLASFYGVGAPATDHGPVDDPTRSGLLTLGAVLSVAAGPEEPSPVLRGRMVREAMLCQPLPDPPPGVVVEPPPIDPSQTTRERWSMHSELEPCASCHRLMDPIGFSFEAFDAVGVHRTHEPNGHPVDVEGEVMGTRLTDGAFSGVQELGAHLANSREVQDCFVSQWFRYAYGAIESVATRCALQRLQDRFSAGGLDVRALILDTVEDDHFVLRTVGEPATTDPPPEPPGPTDPMDPPPPTGSFDVDDRVDSSWPTGECHQVTVTNVGDAEAAWSVTIGVSGTVTDSWNVERSADTGDITWTGVEWNRRLTPGAEASFGYCLER